LSMLVFATTNFAQNTPQTKEEKATVRSKNLEQILTASKMAGLDEKEIGKVKVVIENLYKKQDEINSDESLTPEVRKEKLKAANGEKDWKVKNIMGDKFMAYVEARKKLVADAAAIKQ
jgi:hypothetical protein